MSKKDKIIADVQKFTIDGKLNLTELRVRNKSLYVRISTVFESINEFKDAIKPIECIYNDSRLPIKERSDRYFPTIRLTLRNRMALERIQHLCNDYTLEQIAQMYGVSKQAIHQLKQELIDVCNVQNYNHNKGE